jgi:hypothetical protein
MSELEIVMEIVISSQQKIHTKLASSAEELLEGDSMMLPLRFSGPLELVGVVVGVVETSGIELSVLRIDVTIFARLVESFTFQPSSEPRRLEPFPFPCSDPEFPEHGVNILAALNTAQGNGASKKTARSCH